MHEIPRAQTPEAAGISSAALSGLMRRVTEERLELHSVMVVRGGRVAYEDFRKPYGPGDPHALYSVSKSITSIAVGFAIDEGLLRLEDRAADFLPALREYDSHAYLERLQVVHLVSMSAGKNTRLLADRTKKQWLRDFAEAPWEYAPGEGWHYCNENAYVLCAILRQVTGESVTDFLMPRLFGPLGIERPFWETDGCGVEAGGWGLHLKTEDLAKIGMCYLDGGAFQGRQVIPEAWVRASGAVQRENKEGVEDGYAQGQQGYGYCFWMNTLPGSFRMEGMFSQYVFLFPAYGACIVTTGGECDSNAVYQAVFAHVPALFTQESEPAEIPRLPEYPALREAPRNPELEARLNARCIRFLPTLPLSVMPLEVFFMSADRAGGIDRIHLRFGEDGLRFSWSEGKERNTVLCGMDGHDRKCGITLGGAPFVLACSAAWEGEALRLRLRGVNCAAERLLDFRFLGRAVRMVPRRSPALDGLAQDAAHILRSAMPGKALTGLLVGAAGPFAALAEPVHIGYMQLTIDS